MALRRLLIVLRVKKHKVPSVKDFAQVKNTIQKKLRQQEAIVKAREFGANLLKETQAGKDVKAMLAKYAFNWKSANDVKRHENKVNSAVASLAFRLPHPSKSTPKPTTGMSLPRGDFAIVRLTGVNDGKLGDDNKKMHEVFKTNIENSRGLMEYEFYMQSLMAKAKIKKM